MPGNQVRIGVGVTGVGKASSDVDNLRDKFAKLQAQGAKGLTIGAGAAVATKALDIVGDAIGSVTNFLFDSAAAAREDEESQSRLGASLKANIPNWNGNTAAIEDVLAARMKLGFSDDEQRKSLAILVAATHDSTKALDVQRTAMDLARLKGIDLATASDALTKVEGGQYRALKALGIQLPANATATQALAAVQKVAAGQAEAFANTNSGKLLVSQVKVAEASEKLGYVIMPALATATTVAADAFTFIAENADKLAPIFVTIGAVLTAVAIPAIVSAGVALGALLVEAAPLLIAGAAVVGLANMLGAAWDLATGSTKAQDEALKALAQTASDAAVEYSHSAQGIADDARESNRITRQSAASSADAERGIGDAAKDAADKFKVASDRMIDSALAVKRELLSDAQKIVDDYFGVLITQDQLLDNQSEISRNKRILNSATATKAEKHDAQVALHQLGADKAKYLQDLASAGGSGSKVVQKAMSSYLKELKTAHGAERQAILAEIRALELLAAKAYEAQKRVLHLTSSAFHGNDGPDGRAVGGPVTKGTPYIVGENHPEVFVPDTNGMIIPDVPKTPTGGGSWGGGGGWNGGAIPIPVPANWSPAMQQAFARDAAPTIARELRRQRLL